MITLTLRDGKAINVSAVYWKHSAELSRKAGRTAFNLIVVDQDMHEVPIADLSVESLNSLLDVAVDTPE